MQNVRNVHKHSKSQNYKINLATLARMGCCTMEMRFILDINALYQRLFSLFIAALEFERWALPLVMSSILQHGTERQRVLKTCKTFEMSAQGRSVLLKRYFNGTPPVYILHFASATSEEIKE